MTIHASLCVLRRSAPRVRALQAGAPAVSKGWHRGKQLTACNITIVNPPVSPLQNTN